MPATAAATRETKAKGSATLASSDTQCGGFVILVLAFNWPTHCGARLGPFGRADTSGEGSIGI